MLNYHLTAILINKINIITYFKNLTVKLYILYALNKDDKFYVEQTLFILESISLYIMHNFKLQKLTKKI